MSFDGAFVALISIEISLLWCKKVPLLGMLCSGAAPILGIPFLIRGQSQGDESIYPLGKIIKTRH